MGYGVKFDGANFAYRPPEGVDEDQCATLHVFRNGKVIVSCWELTDEEIAEIVRTRRIFHSIWSGNALFPQYIGSEATTHKLVADFGPVWRLSQPPSQK